MDVEDEPNSYLKYLNDSDTPNTYLLGNNEVGLFSVEPIFTEMEATDWPQEGFPLLLTNSLITEGSMEDQDTSSQSSNKKIIDNTINQNILEYREGNLENTAENTTESKNIQVQNVSDIKPAPNEILLNANTLKLTENNLQLDQEHVQFRDSRIKLNETCIKVKNCMQDDYNCLQVTEADIQLDKNHLQLKNTGLQLNESAQIHKNHLTTNEKYLLVNESSLNGDRANLNLLSADEIPLPNDNSVLKPIDLPFSQNKELCQKKRSVNDLFSTVIANKCKICNFLCEDLEQIKSHISEKHPEFVFTHNGISSGVSLLLSNVKKKIPQNSNVNEEFTVFVCSECHGVCTDKTDLKRHMIQVHNLTMEFTPVPTTEQIQPKVKPKRTKAAYKKISVLGDVNFNLVKTQEKAMQAVKCSVSGCLASFPTEELCNTHAKLHIRDTASLFRCLDCEETFQMWRIARNHMYKEHGRDFGMICCPMCSIYKSYKPVKILSHMMIHTEQKPFVCQSCGKAYKQLPQLKNHEILHRTPEDMPTWCKVKKCDKCQRFFANSKSLKSHIQSVHENFKPFICNICGHKTSRKSMLELHLRQHTGSKPHKCDYCEYKTGDPNCLRKHMMKHVGAVSYQCPYCMYRCIQAGSFKSHLQNKHKGRSGMFFCKYCSYTTLNLTFLQSHEKNHEISSTEGANSADTSAIKTERNETEDQTDEETQSCFLNTESQTEETVDNGGITIPAGLETQLVS